jgi:hypothetical protein
LATDKSEALDRGLEDTSPRPLLAVLKAGAGLPKSVAWHSIAYFTDLDSSWSTVYERAGKPVLIERSFGRGKLILSADSYFLSNEGLRNDRYPALLAWLAGVNAGMVFDETHLGVEEQPGIMTLARRYRLEGFLLGLLLLAALFVWKNTVSVAPAYEDELPGGVEFARGKDSTEAITNLLRRSVPPANLLETCLTEWRRALGHDRAGNERKYKRMEAVAEAVRGQRVTAAGLVEAYRAIAQIVAERE